MGALDILSETSYSGLRYSFNFPETTNPRQMLVIVTFDFKFVTLLGKSKNVSANTQRGRSSFLVTPVRPSHNRTKL